MRIAFAQFRITFGDPDWNRGRSGELISSSDADLIVLPELCTTGYAFKSRDEAASLAESAHDGASVTLWKRLAAQKNLHIVAGIAEKEGDKLFNSAVLLCPSGEVHVYRKTHLFFQEKLWFDPGDTGFPVFDTALARIGIMICFDWIFPESCRTLALAGADIICHPANLVLPYCQDAMVTRCLENHVFAVTANRTGSESRSGVQFNFTGRSRIISPLGEVLEEATERDDSVQTANVDISVARNKQLSDYNDLFKDRRPEFYRLTDTTPEAKADTKTLV